MKWFMRLFRDIDWLGVLAFSLIAQLLLFPMPSFADRVDMMSGNVTLYCSNAADIFKQGVWARTVGIAREIKQAPQGMAVPKSEAEMPRESMYHGEWDTMTEQERAFFSRHLFMGYDEADQIIGRFIAGAGKLPENQGFAVNAVIPPDVGTRMAQAYMDTCLRDQAAKRTFKKVASSEYLPTGSANMVCDAKRQMATWVIAKVVAGVPKDQFWQEHPLPESWSQGMKHWATAMVDEAYLWPRGPEDFVGYIWRNCIEGK